MFHYLTTVLTIAFFSCSLSALAVVYTSGSTNFFKDTAEREALNKAKKHAADKRMDLQVMDIKEKKTPGGSYVISISYILNQSKSLNSDSSSFLDEKGAGKKETQSSENTDPVGLTSNQIIKRYGSIEEDFGSWYIAKKDGFMLKIKFLNDIACKISITVPDEPNGLPYSDALNIIKKFYPDYKVEILGKIEDAQTGAVFGKVNTNPPRYFEYRSEQSLQTLNSAYRPPKFYLDLMDSIEADQVKRGYQNMLNIEKSRIDGL